MNLNYSFRFLVVYCTDWFRMGKRILKKINHVASHLASSLAQTNLKETMGYGIKNLSTLIFKLLGFKSDKKYAQYIKEISFHLVKNDSQNIDTLEIT